MIFFTRIVTFVFCLLLGGILSAEYIIFKSVGNARQEMTKDEFVAASRILMRYQFPMNSNPYVLKKQSKEDVLKKTEGTFSFFEKDFNTGATVLAKLSHELGTLIPLTPEEKNELNKNEESFLRKKIKALNPDLDIIFIPTTLYELKALIYISAYYKKNGYVLQNQIAGELRALSGLVDIFSSTGNLEMLWQSYAYQNYIDGITDLSHKVNNTIIADWLSETDRVINLDLLLPELFKSLHDTYDSKEFIERVQLFSKMNDETFAAQSLQLFKNAIDFDKEAHSKNKATLWRGTKAYARQRLTSNEISLEEWKKRKEWKLQHFIDSTIVQNVQARYGVKTFPVSSKYYTNSYGNSLFSGQSDVGKGGAMPYQYIMRKTFIGYGLFVDKASYRDETSIERNLFFIPPLSTMVGLFARGELFHARSRVALCETTVPRIGGFPEDYTFAFIPKTTENNIIAFTALPATPADHEIIFSKYLVENIRILRNGSGKIDKKGVPRPLIDLETLAKNQLKLPEEKFPTAQEMLTCSKKENG